MGGRWRLRDGRQVCRRRLASPLAPDLALGTARTVAIVRLHKHHHPVAQKGGQAGDEDEKGKNEMIHGKETNMGFRGGDWRGGFLWGALFLFRVCGVLGMDRIIGEVGWRPRAVAVLAVGECGGGGGGIASRPTVLHFVQQNSSQVRPWLRVRSVYGWMRKRRRG